MAKQRYIKDSFWTDPYIEKCTPDEKLVFLYLLTNPQCNIAGVYEIRTKRIAYETGYDIEVIETILNRFQVDNKVILVEDYIIVVNHVKHQYLGSKTAEGINRIIEETPDKIKDFFTKQPFSTEDSGEYDVYILNENIPHICPIQGVSKVPYSKVKLSKVELSKVDNFGEFENVKLTEDEYSKLIEKLGENNTKLMIEELSTGIASKGYKYKSHYATILSWSRRRVNKIQERNQPKQRTII